MLIRDAFECWHPLLSTPKSATPSESRSPARKSTLTQQQKNQKGQCATQEQLTTLEMEFNKNPTPPGPVHDRIANEFQNR